MKLNKKFESAFQRLRDIEFFKATGIQKRRNASNFSNMIETYVFTLNLLKLKRDPERDAKIEKLVTFANEVMIEQREALRSL
jgi:hypothetical protein